jgi:hypothetical protein
MAGSLDIGMWQQKAWPTLHLREPHHSLRARENCAIGNDRNVGKMSSGSMLKVIWNCLALGMFEDCSVQANLVATRRVFSHQTDSQRSSS